MHPSFFRTKVTIYVGEVWQSYDSFIPAPQRRRNALWEKLCWSFVAEWTNESFVLHRYHVNHLLQAEWVTRIDFYREHTTKQGQHYILCYSIPHGLLQGTFSTWKIPTISLDEIGLQEVKQKNNKGRTKDEWEQLLRSEKRWLRLACWWMTKAW